MESFDGKRKTLVREHERKTKSGKKTTVRQHDRTLRNKIINDIQRGIYKAEYGLETDSDSKYFFLRTEKGLSDAEAQYEVFRSRGLLPDNELLDLEDKLHNLHDKFDFEEGFSDKDTEERVQKGLDYASELLDAGKTDEANKIIGSLETYEKIVMPLDIQNQNNKSEVKDAEDLVKEWNEGYLPETTDEFRSLSDNVRKELASGFHGNTPRVEELRNILSFSDEKLLELKGKRDMIKFKYPEGTWVKSGNTISPESKIVLGNDGQEQIVEKGNDTSMRINHSMLKNVLISRIREAEKNRDKNYAEMSRNELQTLERKYKEAKENTKKPYIHWDEYRYDRAVIEGHFIPE